MKKAAIKQKIIKTLNMLPVEKGGEIADFADYMPNEHEEHMLLNGIEKLVEQSQTFQFLIDDEHLYRLEDIKEKY